MKRFTETTKWRDPWFRKLSPLAKLLWAYMTDNCNSIGIIELDMEAAAFDIGKVGNQTVTDAHLQELSSRIKQLDSGKLFITKFIKFQYGRLSEDCPAHKPILRLANETGLQKSGIGYDCPNGKVFEPLKEIEEIKMPAKDKFNKPTREELDLYAAKSGLPQIEVDKFVHHYESNGWKVGPNKMQSWRSAMAGWKTRWEESRRPSLPLQNQI